MKIFTIIVLLITFSFYPTVELRSSDQRCQIIAIGFISSGVIAEVFRDLILLECPPPEDEGYTGLRKDVFSIIDECIDEESGTPQDIDKDLLLFYATISSTASLVCFAGVLTYTLFCFDPGDHYGKVDLFD